MITTKSWNEGVIRQFPWLSPLPFIGRLTERIKIERVHAPLMEVVPSEESGTESSGWYTVDTILLLDSAGASVPPDQPRGHVRKTWHTADGDSGEGETVIDALCSLTAEQVAKISFIVRWQYESSGFTHNPECGELTIYRCGRPGDFDLAAAVRSHRAEADHAIGGSASPASSPLSLDWDDTLALSRTVRGYILVKRSDKLLQFHHETAYALLLRHCEGDVIAPDHRSFRLCGFVSLHSLATIVGLPLPWSTGPLPSDELIG